MSERAAVLCLFVRAPNLGQVKSRLAASTSQALALAAHVHLVQRVVHQVQAFKLLLSQPAQAACKVQLWVAGNAQDAFARQLLEQWQLQLGAGLHQQQGADLGARMQLAVRLGVGGGAPTVIIGGDCPGITASYLQAAFSSLRQGADVVLGPAEDGGYGLIGLTKSSPSLFQHIDWGTDKVLAQTLAQCSAHALQAELLPSVWDVDEQHDWERYCREYSVSL